VPARPSRRGGPCGRPPARPNAGHAKLRWPERAAPDADARDRVPPEGHALSWPPCRAPKGHALSWPRHRRATLCRGRGTGGPRSVVAAAPEGHALSWPPDARDRVPPKSHALSWPPDARDRVPPEGHALSWPPCRAPKGHALSWPPDAAAVDNRHRALFGKTKSSAVFSDCRRTASTMAFHDALKNRGC